ncbi:MAG: T9SS type A sorting domain-containing protein [Phaeodactylibacter sp.]|nr:T9SS type A sorting domain-containing protein [Phaeodactylibacter sp.]MCB9054104.1 T9SS type A sorting domain-containing protein [Lewinellaceae bacterium]
MPYVLKNLGLTFLLLFAFGRVKGQSSCIDPQQIDYTVACPGVEEPVCGCDGITYANACQAENWYGITAWTAGPCAAACDASFMYTYLGDNTFFFYNSSPNFTSYQWIFDGQAVPSPDSARTITYTFESDTSFVCLVIQNGQGCQDMECLLIYPGAPEEMCNVTDCVWPGDANGNGMANNYDLLNIGLGFGLPGPERPFFPDDSDHIAWLPNYGSNWQEWVGPINYKHLDCDGDGFIDEMDVEAITHNYTPDFGFSSSPTDGAPPVYLEFEETEFYITEDSPPYFELNANLYVGNSTAPVFGLHGMALYFTYPLGLTLPQSVVIDYDDNSFFGNINNVLSVRRNLSGYNLGRYDLAFSRKNDSGANGYGKVARLSFIVSADIIEGRASGETPFTIGLGGILFIDPEGNPLEYGSPADATATIIDATTTNSQEVEETEILEVYPNPAASRLFLQFGDRMPERVELSNALGQAVLQRPVTGPSMELDVSALEPGLYILTVYTREGRLSRKVRVE